MRVTEGMKIKASKAEVLLKLHANREKHAAVVKEAQAGYIKAALAATEDAREQLLAGNAVELDFPRLRLPQSYLKVYDTAIAMLDLSVDSTIELDADQVRSFVMNEWDWTEHFYNIAAAYSDSARLYATHR